MIEYDNIVYLIVAFGFVLLNAFFVIAEFSLVKIRTSQVEILSKKKGLKGKILYKVHTNIDIYLSACQFGITLASLGLGWIGEPAFSELLEPVFMFFGVTGSLSKIIAFATGFAIISFLHIVIGELMPKSMAIRQTEKLSLLTCIPLYAFYWLMFPFIWVLNITANKLLKLFKLDTVAEAEYGYTTDEVKIILKSSHLKKPLTEEHRDILLRMVEFSHLQAIDAMRPIEEMVVINYSLSNREKLEVVKENLYTRYPVYQGNKNNIIGVIHTKDILCALDNDLQQENLRPILKVSHHDQLIDVLRKFQQGKPHFALVYKKNKLIGFITLDNLLTIMIGRISDEFHLVKEPWITLANNKFLIKANAPVYAIERLADVDLSEYLVDTVIDLLTNLFGHYPSVDDIWEQQMFIVRPYRFENGSLEEVILELK
ncbi:HlyC/CorC family transporter [Francisella philomiragia]|uniref:Transporter-associated protein, HlyC/CorC family n=1 Tax=Francisella philomiragia subsp. philomiragia (strain ATCC 25017 / CCUG 19701 / FSC 153 / O\|nr:hemolysin family protein [Francisella philomiragia]AJI47953.1 transporter associated domain protein [Francisella philomiragia]AJI49141.1 CBS domain protein [Francisella philomiragia]MBK2019797.1 HlyC/CorC family transporter [Francisella philomiragia]MBK2029749.1 HlyC/CorC family transporter [Francisella philomiragia]MBK2263685.1 HlyC/CorC family transporter [Francisella philomiragia]